VGDPTSQKTTQKVCHISTLHRRYDTRIFQKQCRTLAQAGYEVHWVVADGQGNETHQDVVIHDIGLRNLKAVNKYIDAFTAIKKAKSLQADLYHFHDAELIPAALYLRLTGARVIYDAHEDTPADRLKSEGLGWFKRYLYFVLFYFFEFLGCQFFNYIIAATPHIQKQLKRFTSRVETVNNFPLIQEFLMDPNWSEKKKSICYVGGITVDRGILTTLDALADLKDFTLELAGPCQPSLLDRIKSHPQWGKVNYHGYVDRKQVRNIYQKSQYGLVLLFPKPNHINALPTKFFEYMTAGMPIVVSNFPLWQQLISENNCGISIDPEDPKALAEGILQLSQNSEKAKAMGLNGQKAVKNKYNWEIEARKLLRVYKHILQPTNLATVNHPR
jgi:glycosyltransferase involved in cell wall biosynthesis